MTSPLFAAIRSGDLSAAQAALPGASAREIRGAFGQAIRGRDDRLFDLILPCVPSPSDLCDQALHASAMDGYLHALTGLLPAATDVSTLLVSAIAQRQEKAALLIVEHLPPGAAVSPHFTLAVVNDFPAVARALIPFATQEDLRNTLFIAAPLHPVFAREIAASLDDVGPVIDRLLASGQCDEDGIPPDSSVAGADSLLGFLPLPRRLGAIAQYPVLRESPIASATLQQAALECAIAPVPNRPSPRL